MNWVERVAFWIEGVGVAVIVVGAVLASLYFGKCLLERRAWKEAYDGFRANLGRAILLGLEFLVAGDIVATIIVDQTLESVAVLAVVVLIRTFLSFALETEIEGRPPWRRRVGQAPRPS
ncbi:MAG: DUF1622 domain-containing protein [Gemmatimonadota bacterium]